MARTSGSRSLKPALLGLLGLGLALAPPGVASEGRRGEAFTFRLSLGPIEGGRARLSIAPATRSGVRSLVHVVGQAEAVGIFRVLTRLRDDYHLVLDADTLLPQQMKVVESGLRSRTVTAAFSGRRADIRVERPDDIRRLQRDLPAEPYDPVAALLLMRSARLETGDRMDLLVLDGAAFYEGTIEVIGREHIQTDAGPRAAIAIRCTGERILAEGQRVRRPRRQATLWLSDDALRVPLRLEGETDLGTARVELTSHEPPLQPLPAPRRLPGVRIDLSPRGH